MKNIFFSAFLLALSDRIVLEAFFKAKEVYSVRMEKGHVWIEDSKANCVVL